MRVNKKIPKIKISNRNTESIGDVINDITNLDLITVIENDAYFKTEAMDGVTALRMLSKAIKDGRIEIHVSTDINSVDEFREIMKFIYSYKKLMNRNEGEDNGN